MTFEEMKAIANKTTTRKKSRHIESQIQQSCVKWFRLQFPEIGLLLFAVPNGGARNKREAGILKGEGVTAGVADMILLKPSGGFASLCIQIFVNGSLQFIQGLRQVIDRCITGKNSVNAVHAHVDLLKNKKINAYYKDHDQYHGST